MLETTGRLLFIIQFAILADFITARIVSLPHQRYVLEGNQGSVRCQNRSDDGTTFYSYITNAIWYRDYRNGTIVQIGDSGPVYADKHTLIISSMTGADQGLYYCCVSAGALCGNSSSASTTILLSTPAVIDAAITTYISTVGSNVTLICTVSDKGTPPATFSWRRNGYELNDNNIVNDTVMALVLTNVTMESVGTYVCSGTGVLSYRSDVVELIVEDSLEWSNTAVTTSYGEDVILSCRTNVSAPTNYGWEQVSGQSLIVENITTLNNGSLFLTNVQQSATFKCTVLGEHGVTLRFVELVVDMNNNTITTASQLIYLQNTDTTSSCHDTELEEYLIVTLQSYLHHKCGCTNFKVTVNCNDTAGSIASAVYGVQLVGPLANDLLQLWLMQKANDKNEIELDVATFTLCNQTCTAVTETMSENKHTVPTEVFIAAAICIIIILMILNLWILYCYRSSMIRKRRYKIHTRVRTSASTCSESGPLPGNYDKLNHTYSRDTPTEPKIEYNKKPTVKAMANGMGIVRSNGITAILNPPTWNVDIDSVAVTPSKTHVSYYDVTLPSNSDHR
ncbi:netrin receptor DCC-like isoform X3 [Dysidea avara]|uniref:netrin receptor DCC-like isoform X3 n=1 Tax=Dysidea avara TaxID=196820 RepID=UPI00331D4F95